MCSQRKSLLFITGAMCSQRKSLLFTKIIVGSLVTNNSAGLYPDLGLQMTNF